MRIISPSILGVSIAAIPVFVGASKDSWERSSSRSFVIYFIALSSAMSRMIVSSRLDYYARPRVFLFMSER
jgi:heme/copper-type cytochrome/quinol oxidase subunit 1